MELKNTASLEEELCLQTPLKIAAQINIRLRTILLIFLSLILLTSCTSEFQSFNDTAFEFANNDKRIDQKEFESLLEDISASEERGFAQFKNENGTIENAKVLSYLLKYYSAKNLNLTESDIWQPNDEMPLADNFNINVFLENSGSMNGYLNDPNTQFKNSVYSLLTRLKLFADKDSLNLYLINKDNQLIFGNASNDDVEEFKNILNPASFKNISQGKTGETDINELIKRCLGKVNGNNLSVFISDCIYSPGKSRTDAAMYLAEQKQGIFLNFATELRDRNSDLSVLILQLDAGFKGTYYDKSDTKVNFNELINRPYYIWFIGTNKQIGKLLSSRKLKEIDGGILNQFVLQSPQEESQPNYKIQYSPKIGNFSAKELSNKTITDAALSKDNQNKGFFGFNLAVDFSNSIQDPSYFLDTSNYVLSNPNYQIEVESISNQNDPSLSGFTHLIKLKTTDLRNETLEIQVVGQTPSWVYNSSSIDDSNILDDTSEQQKTFGLQYLIEGVSDAFYPKSSSNAIFTFTVTIKK